VIPNSRKVNKNFDADAVYEFQGPADKSSLESIMESARKEKRWGSEATEGAKSRFRVLFLRLVRRILVVDPAKRVTAAEALKDEFFKEKF
jgi:serine/threonine protein kinase